MPNAMATRTTHCIHIGPDYDAMMDDVNMQSQCVCDGMQKDLDTITVNDICTHATHELRQAYVIVNIPAIVRRGHHPSK